MRGEKSINACVLDWILCLIFLFTCIYLCIDLIGIYLVLKNNSLKRPDEAGALWWKESGQHQVETYDHLQVGTIPQRLRLL